MAPFKYELRQCFALKLAGKLYGGCRIVEMHSKFGPAFEGADWFGAEPPSLADIERARPALRTDALDGPVPVRFFLITPSKPPPKGSILLGTSARSFKVEVTRGATEWDQIHLALRDSWSESKGKSPKGSASDPSSNLREEVEEVVSMWGKGEYDNLKDAILDARGLLPKVRRRLPKLAPKLQKVLDQATRELQQLVRDDPSMAGYARGLIPRTPARKK